MWMSLLPEGVCVCGLVSSGQKIHVSSLGTRAIDGSKSISGARNNPWSSERTGSALDQSHLSGPSLVHS